MPSESERKHCHLLRLRIDSSSFIGTPEISADLITVTFTEAQDGTTVYRTSLIERTATATATPQVSELATQRPLH